MLTLKWGLIKERKREFLADALERAGRRHTVEKWIKNAKAMLFLKFVYNTYSDARQKFHYKKLIEKSAKIIQKTWKRYRKRLSTESMRKITKPHGKFTVNEILDFKRTIRR